LELTAVLTAQHVESRAELHEYGYKFKSTSQALSFDARFIKPNRHARLKIKRSSVLSTVIAPMERSAQMIHLHQTRSLQELRD
jgi:hypothetical protein